MGFEKGNILEPSMGVGNFFGMLPDSMLGSRLYGVELDSITGRIAQKLYPQAEIKVAGFETTDRRDFYDLAVGNVPFGNYRVSDKPYDKLGFSIHNYFFAKHWIRFGPVVSWPLLPAAIRWIPKIRTHESIWRSGQNCWELSDFPTTHSVPMPVRMWCRISFSCKRETIPLISNRIGCIWG